MAGPRVGNRYELQRRLEQRDGILSFEGWDTEQQRDVLVLLMRASGGGTAEEQTRLLQFARLAGLAGTETDYALPAILDSGSDPPDQNGETSYYLIADWLSGTSLDSKLPLEPERAVTAVRDIGEGLRWARQRFAGATPTYDLDPARIVLDDDGKARLTTFGLPGLGGEEGEQNDVLALGNLLRTLLAGGASNEARSLSAAQALALAQVIGRSTASTSSRYANIPAFLDALQAALEGRQTPDPKFTAPPRRTAPFNAAAAALASIPAPTAAQAAKDAAADAAAPPLTVSPIPDELADTGDDDEAGPPSSVPSAPPSMGPLPQSTSTLVDAAQFTPPAPTNGNGEMLPPPINEPPSSPPEHLSSLRRFTPPSGQPTEDEPNAAPEDSTAAFTAIPYTSPPPLPRSGATSNSFFDPPRSDAPDIAEVGKAVNKRQPMLRPAPRLVDPQTGQLRGELYVAGSKRNTGVMATLTNNNRMLVYLGIIVVILIFLLLLATFNSNKNNQQAAVINSTPVARLTATLADVVLAASPTPARLATTATSVAIVAPASPTAVPSSPTAVAAVPQPTACNVSLGDVLPDDPDYSPISRMVCIGAFYPVPGGQFQKNTAVTRAEIAHAAVAAMGWQADPSAANPFSDVNANTPYFNDIITVVQRGVMSGVTSDKFNPNGKVSRIQAVRVVVKAAGWPPADPSTVQHYVDVGPPGSGSNPNPLFIYVEAAYAHGVIGPTPGDKFSPNDPATRKDAAIMLNNMLNNR